MAAIAASSISTPGAITLELPGSSRWDTTTARRDFRASSSRGSRPYGAKATFHDRAQSARAGLAVDGLAGNGAQGRVRPPQDRGFRLLVTGNGIKLSMLPTVRHEDSATSTRKKNNPGKELEARMQQVPTDTKRRVPSSRVLEEVIHQAPAEYVTVGWLTSTLHRHSFGIIMLSLGLLATTPVGSTVPGFILAVMAVQLIVGRGEPVFPRFIMTQRLPAKQLLRLGGRAIHVLKYHEKVVHPRWPMTFEAAKRAVGVMVLLLTVVLLLTPVPLSNVAPAMVISLISLAYIEEDGLLLSVGFLAAIILIGLGSAAVWGAIVGAVLISV
jgi:hypothetical protein